MLPLIKSLTPRLQAECAGLESGNAPILEKVTPVTAALLRWWFQQDYCDGGTVNFHPDQKDFTLRDTLPQNRRDQQVGAEHKLVINPCRPLVFGELKEQGSHRRRAGFAGLWHGIVDVG